MTVEVSIDNGVGYLTLNRPERKNAITGPLGVALAVSLDQLSKDDNVQVILLSGSGGAFCSGLDLKEFNADPKPDWLDEFQAIWRGAHKALYDCPKPIVGALQRYAINGGAALALACDHLVVGEEAFLQVGEVQQGMAAPYNLAWLRLRHSLALASELALVGKRHKGADLYRLGIANEVVADEDVLNHATQLAKQMAEYPAGALQRIKTGLRIYSEPDADTWFDQVAATVAGGSGKPIKQKA